MLRSMGEGEPLDDAGQSHQDRLEQTDTTGLILMLTHAAATGHHLEAGAVQRELESRDGKGIDFTIPSTWFDPTK